ncbi:hypothetical protein STXM2123_5777 [Streptomyces sp. F-3]|nr:hypothetical protein STXM2123_5777 [Streptomyces sp. F-3]
MCGRAGLLLTEGGGAGGSLFDAIEAEEAVVQERVEELDSRMAELTVRLEAERERLSRLVITRETTGELLARNPTAHAWPPSPASSTPVPHLAADNDLDACWTFHTQNEHQRLHSPPTRPDTH